MKLTSHELTNVQSIQLTQILCFYLAEGIHNSSVDESSVAGLESSLPFEKDDKMKELPTIKYDQKNVSYRKIISFLERICRRVSRLLVGNNLSYIERLHYLR